MALAAPLLLLFLRSLSGEVSSRHERWLAFALPIVRIDLCVVALASALVLRNRRGLHLALATVAGACLQLLVMKLVFGHFVSVAAMLKTTNSFASLAENLRANLLGSTFQAGLLIADGVLAGFALRTHRNRTMLAVVGGAQAFVAMHMTLSVLRAWYLLPSTLAMIFVAQNRIARPARIIVAAIAVAFAIRAVRAEFLYRDDQQAAATFVSELRRRVAPGTRIYSWGGTPGFLGFRSAMQVVDGDGLVNDDDYAQRLIDWKLAGYLEEQRVCHVVVADADADPVLDVGGITLRRNDVEQVFVVRRKIRNQSDFALYRINAERCR